MKRNKRGNFMDVLIFPIVGFILFVAIISCYIAYKNMDTSLVDFATQNPGIYGLQNVTDTQIHLQAERYPSFWDFIIVFVMFGMWLAMILAAVMLGNNSSFAILYVIGSFALIIVGLFFQYAAQTLMENPEFGAYLVRFPITSFVFNWFFLFCLGVIITVGLALYIKPGSEPQ